MMDVKQFDSIGNIVGYGLAAVAVLSLGYRHSLLGMYKNILKWPYREMYAFIVASRKRDYLIRQSGMIVVAVTAPLYLPFQVPIGLLAALVAGILVSLHYLFTPPGVLFLSSSFPGVEQSFDAIRDAIAPQRVVALLSERQIPDIRPNCASWDNLRTLDETTWRDTVHRLMALAQIVVIDLRVMTDNVHDELMRLMDSPYATKVLCITDDETGEILRNIIHDHPQGQSVELVNVMTAIAAIRKRHVGQSKGVPEQP